MTKTSDKDKDGRQIYSGYQIELAFNIEKVKNKEIRPKKRLKGPE